MTNEITQTNYSVETPDAIALSATLFLSSPRPRRLAFILHGFSSSKNSSTNKALVPLLLARDVSAVTFDFRGCGESTGELGQTTITSGKTDFESIINDALQRDRISEAKEFIFIGSSFGGAVAIATAKRFHPKGLLLKSPMIDIAEAQMRARGPDAMRNWENQGFLRMERRSGIVNLSFDYIRDAQRYNFFDPTYCAMSEKTVIVQGNFDTIAPLEFTQSFVDVCPLARRLFIVDGAGHEYDNPAQFARMVDLLESGMDIIFD